MEDKDIRYILDNIIKKATYNKNTKKYEIKKEDYQYLNLTSKQKQLLKSMCNNIGISLEYIPYTKEILPSNEDEILFEEYNQILDKIKITTNLEEKKELEQRRINLRNKIWNDNIELVRTIIERRINKLDNIKEYEDIIQTSYVILLEYIDKNYLYKGIFKDYISKILILYASRRMLTDKEGIGSNTKTHLEEINKYKCINETIDLEELSKTINLSKRRIEELLTLSSITYPLSIEAEISLINSKEFNDDSILYDDTFEKTIIENQRKDTILKILKTLSKIEQEVLLLYFGFHGQIYTTDEIGKMYNTTRAYISFIINKALNNIKTSIRINYLKEIYETKDIYQEEQTSNKLLEEFLIRNLPQSILEYITPYLEKDILNFFEIYINNHDYKLKEMANSLNISIAKAHRLKLKTLSSIQYIISNQLNNNSKEKITYEEYLNYLMQLWMHNGYIKRKVR